MTWLHRFVGPWLKAREQARLDRLKWATVSPLAVPILEQATLGPPLRGRVHKVSIVAGGEVSVVLRFGGEEVAARALDQGALAELRVAPAPPAPSKEGP